MDVRQTSVLPLFLSLCSLFCCFSCFSSPTILDSSLVRGVEMHLTHSSLTTGDEEMSDLHVRLQAGNQVLACKQPSNPSPMCHTASDAHPA